MVFAREIKPGTIGVMGGSIYSIEDEFAVREEGLIDFGESGF